MMLFSRRRNLLHRDLPALVLLLGIGGLCGPAAAQTPFAIYNIGQRMATDDARMVARGGWGMAVDDPINPGFKNIASLSSLTHLALKFTGFGDKMESEDTRGQRMNSRVFVPDVRVAGPVFKGRVALTAGFVVNRSSQYHTLADTSWGWVWEDSVSGDIQFDRVGNRFRVPLGGALELLRGLSVGGTINIEGGSLKGTTSNFFTSPSGGSGPLYQTNVKETKDEFHGTSQTWSLLLNPLSWVQLGASWTPAHKIEADRTVTQFGLTRRAESSYTMEMPDEYMAGIQLRPFGRWQLGADAQFMEFSKFTGPEDWMVDMEDEYSLSVGLERKMGRARRGGWSNLPIRLGASYRRWAYGVGGGPEAEKGNPIDEKMVSVGTGFPFQQSLGSLDLALSYGIIGDLEENGLETTFWRLTVSVTGLEAWW